MDLPGFSARPGFKAPFYGDGQSALNPGTTVPIKDVPMSKRKSLNNENNLQQLNPYLLRGW